MSADIGYVLYSALGSFYIPSCIMVFVYIRIYFAARARSRRAQENKAKRRQSQTIRQEAQQKQAAEAAAVAASAIGTLVSKTASAMHNSPPPGTMAAVAADAQLDETTGPPTAGCTDAEPTPPAVVANGHPPAHRQETDRRLSLTSEMSGLKTSPGLPAVPSVSLDRISHQDQQNPQYLTTEVELRSTAPGSLMAVNDSTTMEPVALIVRHPSRQSSLKKNGSERTSRHSVTFERNSVEDVATVYVATQEVESMESAPAVVAKCETAETTALPCATVLLPAQQSAAPGSSRRASLIFPTRKKLEKFARRLTGSDTVGTSSSALPPIQQSDGDAASKVADLPGHEEWSTSSSPSSPGHVTKAAEAVASTPAAAPESAADTAVSPPAAPDSAAPASAAVGGSSKKRASKKKKKNKDDATVENELPSEMDPSSSDSGTVARCTVVRPLKIRFFRPGNSSGTSNSVKKSSKAKRQVLR